MYFSLLHTAQARLSRTRVTSYCTSIVVSNCRNIFRKSFTKSKSQFLKMKTRFNTYDLVCSVTELQK